MDIDDCDRRFFARFAEPGNTLVGSGNNIVKARLCDGQIGIDIIWNGDATIINLE